MPQYKYDYLDFTFELDIPIYWETIYRGKPHERLYGAYSIVLDKIRGLVDKKRVVLDVGVNHGIFAVPCSMLGYAIIGFEPVKENYHNIEKAAELNNLHDFHIVNAALSDENMDTAIMYVPECPDNASFSKEAAVLNMKRKEYAEEVVQTIKFDDWIKQHPEFSDIGFIKIDTQGAEFKVISGMKEFLSQAKDVHMLVEFEPHLNLMGHSYGELEALIKSYGFDYIGNWGSDKAFFKP